MERHRWQQSQSNGQETSADHDYNYESDDSQPIVRRRRASDSTLERPRQRGGLRSDSDSEEEVEQLPDRFDSHGRPLDGRTSSADRWTNRSGEFRREPRRQGDWDVRGAWHVGGTDNEAVERIAHGVTNALEGRGSWMGVIGEVLGGGLLGPPPPGGNDNAQHGREQGDEDDDEDYDRRRRRRRR
jgi:hypothetical protein